jgi:hypothetical protein
MTTPEKGAAMSLLPTAVFNTSVHPPAGVDENRAIDRAAWNSMVASARLPTGELDENRAIDCIATVLIPMVRHRLEKDYSREWLEIALRDGLREGRQPLTDYAVYAAEKGEDEICDAALRAVGAELQMLLLQRRDLPPAHLQIIAYFARAGQRAPHERRGPRWHDSWFRNIQICRLIELTCREFGVHPTRNREARRANRSPSGVSLVVAAMGRHGIPLTEVSVQENLWFGLAGEMVRDNIPPLPAGSYQHPVDACG